jgi:mannonate dehydratase
MAIYSQTSRRAGGIEVDEKAAAKYPFRSQMRDGRDLNGGWGEVRKRDGQIIKQ